MMNLAYAWLVIFQIHQGSSVWLPMPDMKFCQQQATEWNKIDGKSMTDFLSQRGYATCIPGYPEDNKTLIQGRP